MSPNPLLLRYNTLMKKGGEKMKKIAFLLAVILVISAPLTVSAATYALTIKPHLSFNGTTATCAVTVVGNNMSEHIEVEMKLMHGTTCVASWYRDSYGFVNLQETATAVSGWTYELVVSVTVNGVSKTPVTQCGTC